MSENTEDKLIAVAQHIAKSLSHTDTALTDDILQIFSNFDNRFRDKLSGNLSVHDTKSSLEQTLKTVDRRVSKYLTVDQPIWSNPSDASLFLTAVDELISLIHEGSVMSDDATVTSCLDKAEDLLQQCMFRLEEEFKRLCSRAAVGSDSDEGSEFDDVADDVDIIPVAYPVTDYNITVDGLSSATVNDLYQISNRMVTAGYGKECSLAYSGCRRGFIEESLSRLGFVGLQSLNNNNNNNNNKQVVDDVDDSDVEVEKWIKAINMAVRVIYPSEKRLCDRVFGCASAAAAAAADLAFMDACRVSVTEMLNFANAIAMGSRAPERLFKMLDVYEAVKALLPEFEVLFSGHYCLVLKNEAVEVWKRLGESVRGVFVELENLIRRDPTKGVVPGGGLHPITRYVMNYLRAACSRPTLAQVFDDSVDQSSSSLSVQISWIMEVLESNLEAKSKAYRDHALSSVFMMNNGRYIVKKVKDDELGALLGDDWIRAQKSKVRHHHVSYQRSSWHKILNTLKLDSHNSSSSLNLASKALKDKLKLFNSQFTEISKTQSTWTIFDEQLREELKVSVAGNLLPAYRNFLGRFHSLPDMGKYADKNVKFTIEDVETRIEGLFQASAVAGSGRK